MDENTPVTMTYGQIRELVGAVVEVQEAVDGVESALHELNSGSGASEES